jgi:hypothetical protein
MDIRTERATQPVELTDAELDHVQGGVAVQHGNNTFIYKGPDVDPPAFKVVHHGGNG